MTITTELINSTCPDIDNPGYTEKQQEIYNSVGKSEIFKMQLAMSFTYFSLLNKPTAIEKIIITSLCLGMEIGIELGKQEALKEILEEK